MKLLLVDDDENLLDALGEFFETAVGAKCLMLRGLNDLIARKQDVLDSVVLAIVDINLGPGEPTGIDVYHWLRENRFPGKIVFLTGHAKDNPLVQEAVSIGETRVFSKPIEVDKLLSLVEEPHNDPNRTR